MRDDFSQSVKKAVAERVGNRCSNPDCRALTSGPQIDDSKSLNLGVAAHISAASSGGPRYDRNLSMEIRCSAGNAIWLCQSCGKLIDNDPRRFHAELLRSWKGRAEAEAREAIGKTVPQAPGSPDIRLEVRAGIAIQGSREFMLLSIKVENHSPFSVFIDQVYLQLRSGDQFFVGRDFLTGEYQKRREVRPGDAFDFHVNPLVLVEHSVEPEQVVGIAARDALGRVYTATEEDLPGLIRHLLAPLPVLPR